MFSESMTVKPSSAQQAFTGSNGKELEIRALLALLFLTNLGLLIANIPAANLIFQTSNIASGEWWRILTWPFVHISRYHLFLDGAAFLLLYSSLMENKRSLRIGYSLTVTAGSLLLPLWISPEISKIGLCGLSGPAHGLMAISALEMLKNSDTKKIGQLFLTGLFLKIGFELSTGTAFLQQLHFGDIGQPIVATHAGGALAGAIGYKTINFFRKPCSAKQE